jgi:hypothetical protein
VSYSSLNCLQFNKFLDHLKPASTTVTKLLLATLWEMVEPIGILLLKALLAL